MPEQSNNPFNFWNELKRRKVIRVLTVYAAAAFVILEVVSIIVDPLRLPEWTLPLIIVLLVIGFILSTVLSWVYDITPEGIQKTKSKSQDKNNNKKVTSKGWKISTYTSLLVIIAFVVFYIVSNLKKSSDISKLEKTIAVLPFENFSHQENDSHLGDAIANEMATQLVKIQGFQVRSFTSSLQYKGSDKPPMPQIGVELHANFIIEGTIELQNEDVSIHVQVIQAENDNHIWAHEFKDKWDNIFKLRRQITTRIADELKTILSPEEIENIEKKPTENTEAYNLYLRGNYFLNQRTEEGLLKAINYFNQAAQVDANYALAYIGLANSYLLLRLYAPVQDFDNLSKAEQAALKALNIDNSLAEAHTSIAYVYFSYWKLKDAEKEYIKAIELNPEYARAHHWYSVLLASQGRYDQAIEEMLIASDLEPLSLVIIRNIGFAYRCARQFDKAIETLSKVIDIDPDFPAVQFMMAEIYFYKGMYKEALSAIEKSEERYWGLKGIIYDQMGDRDNAHKVLEELVKLSEMKEANFISIPLLYFALGYEDQGFSYLEKQYEAKLFELTFIMTYPLMDQFRSDPRFIDLLKRMELIVD